MVPFSKCFFIAFLMRNFFLSSSMPGYFFTMNFRTDWYETPDLVLQDCKAGEPEIKRIVLKQKGGRTWNCLQCWIYKVCTHLKSFNEDIIHFVLSACKVGNRNLFAGSDASPRRNRPFHLLGFSFLILVAIFQPVTTRSKIQVQSCESFL